ncbi:MAG: phosphoribosyl-AMP cyclohydrolase [Thermoplasmatota archaeon]
MSRKPAPKRRRAKAPASGLRAFRIPSKPGRRAGAPQRRIAAAKAFAAPEPLAARRLAAARAFAEEAPPEGPASRAAEVEVTVVRPAVVLPPPEVAPPPKVHAAPAHSAVAEPEEGLQVVAKGASKFSPEDLELLKRLIVPKGQAIIDGFNLDLVKFNDEGLVPLIAQDAVTGAVVTQAWANREALEKTLREKQVTVWNRKTEKLQSAEPGHAQRLLRLLPDCDQDTLLAEVEQEGTACHRDTGTCWSDGKGLPVATSLGTLDRALAERTKGKPADAVDAMKDLVENTKIVVGALRGHAGPPLEKASADLIRTLLVACRAKGVGLEPILRAVETR